MFFRRRLFSLMQTVPTLILFRQQATASNNRARTRSRFILDAARDSTNLNLSFGALSKISRLDYSVNQKNQGDKTK
jgi:hypothetical protein